jgi:GNAT superfamily N-acetyltransferase
MEGSSADNMSVRAVRPGDAAALERLHAEVARYYAEPVPHYFRSAVRNGSRGGAGPDWAAAGAEKLCLVAEVEGEVVGALAARLLTPAGERPAGGEPEEKRLRIDYLATAAERRRSGVGTRLVEAAETWGRGAGATIAETTTFQGGPLSVPFWEERMGYEELSTTLEKRL